MVRVTPIRLIRWARTGRTLRLHTEAESNPQCERACSAWTPFHGHEADSPTPVEPIVVLAAHEAYVLTTRREPPHR